jgi:5-methylthioadenosine/S-adenosylhomocysteine deaminase
MATLGGAKVLGMDQIIGSISPGKKADLILINLNQPHLVPVTDPWYTLVNTVKGADVTDVFVDGRHRVTQGKLTPVTTSET